MKNLTLPSSGFVLELKETVTYGEYKALENVMLSGASGKIVGGEMTQSFDGSVLLAYQKKLISTFVVSCKSKAGEVLSLDVDTLDAADGLLVEETITKIYDSIKKK